MTAPQPDPVRRLQRAFRPTHPSIAALLQPLSTPTIWSLAPPLFADAVTDPAVLGPRYLLLGLLARSMLRGALGSDWPDRLSWLDPDRAIPLQWLDAVPDPDQQVATALTQAWSTSPKAIADPFGPLLRTLIPSSDRRRLGEFYTPDWLADRVIDRVDAPDAVWLDPTLGAGVFFLAVARRQQQQGRPMPTMFGMERNPWGLLFAVANTAWTCRHFRSADTQKLLLPWRLGDLLIDEVPTDWPTTVTRIVGNPPWVLWDDFDADLLAPLRRRCEEYGMLTETGMASILGAGKKDLAGLIAMFALDQCLRPDGKLACVLPQALFSTVGSGRGFRRGQLPTGQPWRIEHVDDLTRLNPFGVGKAAVVAVLSKDQPMTYPVPYVLWRRKDAPAEPRRASPIDPDDPLSPWLLEDAADATGTSMIGRCAYHAHLGVNTGGANGVYWMERLEVLGPGRWRMRNRANAGKLTLPTVEVELEPTFLYPLLVGADVRAGSAAPSAWILLVQDVQRRRGIEPAELKRIAPKTLAYLEQFATVLRSRAAYRRYFTRANVKGQLRERGAYYSMFDVGAYTLASIKVVWRRMGRKLGAAVVGMLDGKPILPQETHAFFTATSMAEAHYLADWLNQPAAQAALERFAQVGGKSFATPQSIHRLAIPRFNAGDGETLVNDSRMNDGQ